MCLFELTSLHKYSFRIECQDSRLGVPDRLIVGRQEEESGEHVVLKALSFLLFFRERLQIGGHLYTENIPFVPDLLQLSYEGHPTFWAECGESEASRIKKIVAKAPEAEIWWVREKEGELDRMMGLLKKAGVRSGRVKLLGMPEALVQNLCQSLQAKNEIYWMPAEFDPPGLQFDFNQEWIESSFEVGAY